MDFAEILVTSGGLLLIGFILWFFFGKREENVPAPADGSVVYACPMHPYITSSDPTANCSICGMKLNRTE